MKERTDRRYLKEPDELNDYNAYLWFTQQRRPMECGICGSKMTIGERFAVLMSNFGANKYGNPFVGECCIDLDPKELLEIYNLQDSFDVRKIAKDTWLANK